MVSYFAGGQKGFDGIDTHLTTPFDFPMNSAIREVVNHGASAKKIVDVLRQDRLYPHPELLVTFIGNHDMKRFVTDAGGSTVKLKLASRCWRPFAESHKSIRATKSPCRAAKIPTTVAIFPEVSRATRTTRSHKRGRTPEEQDVYAHVQGLLKLRREHPALRVGGQKHVVVDR